LCVIAEGMPHPIPTVEQPPIDRLREIMHILRAPGGCPWDAEQTHESLVKHCIEEAYEVADAVASGDPDALVDELGDLLLQPVFHAEIASETNAFDWDDIVNAICEKLVRRHPHVFGEAVADDSGAVLAQWEDIKTLEKSRSSAEGGSDRVASESQEGLPKGSDSSSYLKKANEGLPSLMAARKIQKKVARVGFDWPDIGSVVEKVREELAETEELIGSGERERLGEEIGDLLFAVVNLARKCGFESEELLHAANRKFVNRFQAVEQGLRERGGSIEEATLEEMDREWERVKSRRGSAEEISSGGASESKGEKTG